MGAHVAIKADEAYASDVIIVGGGIAGLYAALHLAPLSVTVITAASLGQGASSTWAQGGIAAALADTDSAELHQHDTLSAGAGLCSPEAVALITKSAAAEIERLEHFGVAFDHDSDGERLFSHEAAHSHRRVLRIGGDRAGFALMRSLIDRAKHHDRIQVIDCARVLTLQSHEAEQTPHVMFERDGKCIIWQAQSVILATGGIGGLFSVTTNPDEISGQGLALALMAGAKLRDVEFIQFHPTALAVGKTPSPLLTEALRGEGARLVDRLGASIIPASEARGDLAPRDVVAAAVYQALQDGREAFLDCRHLFQGRFEQHFPQVFASCKQSGIDPNRDLLPIAPAAHYHMGGIATDLDALTTLEDVYAVGECAATGAHGANRLASNSLLESLVFARRAALAIKSKTTKNLKTAKPITVLPSFYQTFTGEPEGQAYHVMRQLMSDNVGVIRNKAKLQSAHEAFANYAQSATSYAQFSRGLVCQLIALAALTREESRGAHRRDDFPKTQASWQKHLTWELDGSGRGFLLTRG